MSSSKIARVVRYMMYEIRYATGHIKILNIID